MDSGSPPYFGLDVSYSDDYFLFGLIFFGNIIVGLHQYIPPFDDLHISMRTKQTHDQKKNQGDGRKRNSFAYKGNLFREGHFKWARIYRRCMHHFGCENDSDSRHGVNAVDERFLTESKENDGNWCSAIWQTERVRDGKKWNVFEWIVTIGAG